MSRDSPHALSGRPRVSAIVPVSPAAAVLDDTLRSLARYLTARGPAFEILVVDDGSAADTATVTRRALERIPGRLVQHPEPRGIGAAVRTGVLAASGRWVLVVEADLATPPDCLDALASVCRERDLDGAVGSRAAPGADVDDRRSVAARWSDRATRAGSRRILDVEHRDPLCGFAWLDVRRVRPLFEQMIADGIGWTAELLFLAARLGVTLAEVPVSWRAPEGRGGLGPVGAFRTLAELARVRWRFRRGGYVGAGPGDGSTARRRRDDA